MRQASLRFLSIPFHFTPPESPRSCPHPPELCTIQPHLFDRSSMAKQNLSHRANVICNGSPSRIRMVRRISLGITTRPRSSMRRTIPVAFIYKFPPVKADFSLVVSAVAAVLCTGSFWQRGGIHRKRKALYRTFLGKRQTFRVQL